MNSFFTTFVARFSQKHTTTLASSLAYYTALSLAPLVVLFISISSKLSAELQRTFLSEVQNIVGPEASRAFEMIIDSAKQRPDLATLSGLIGGATLLLSASLIFGELRSALNQIFETPLPQSPNENFLFKTWHFLKARLLTAGLALGFIFLMIVSLVISSMIKSSLGSNEPIWNTLNILISLVSYVGLFTLLFHFIPARHIPWKCAWQGGLITATLFVIGKELIAVYLGKSALGSAYGAAGSLIVLLVWVYYSTLITFIGAHASSILLSSRTRTGPKPHSHRPSPASAP